MIMKKLLLIVLILFSLNSIFAQNDSLFLDSCNTCKNEIGINLAPAASVFMTGGGLFYNYALTYKRMVKNGALRFRLSYTPSYSYHYYSPYAPNTFVIEKDDSITTSYSQELNPKCYGLHIGYEKHRQGRWTKDFYGIDLTFNINTIDYSSVIYTQTEDTMIFDENSRDNAETILYRIGVNLFYGWKIPISNQFLLSIQFGANFGYYFGEFAYPDEDYMFVKRHTESFDLSKYFINDLSLAIKF